MTIRPALVADLLERRAAAQWSRDRDREISDWFTVPWLHTPRAARVAISVLDLVRPDRATTADERAARTAVGRAYVLMESVALDLDNRHGSAVWRLVQLNAAADVHLAPYRSAMDFAQDVETKIYWLADLLSEAVRQETRGPGTVPWYIAGEVAAEGLKIIQKWAANSTAGGYAANGPLERICQYAIRDMLIPVEKIAGIVTTWRYHDALDGRPARQGLDTLFKAAWDLGKYELAYQLVKE